MRYPKKRRSIPRISVNWGDFDSILRHCPPDIRLGLREGATLFVKSGFLEEDFDLSKVEEDSDQLPFFFSKRSFIFFVVFFSRLFFTKLVTIFEAEVVEKYRDKKTKIEYQYRPEKFKDVYAKFIFLLAKKYFRIFFFNLFCLNKILLQKICSSVQKCKKLLGTLRFCGTINTFRVLEMQYLSLNFSSFNSAFFSSFKPKFVLLYRKNFMWFSINKFLFHRITVDSIFISLYNANIMRSFYFFPKLRSFLIWKPLKYRIVVHSALFYYYLENYMINLFLSKFILFHSVKASTKELKIFLSSFNLFSFASHPVIIFLFYFMKNFGQQSFFRAFSKYFYFSFFIFSYISMVKYRRSGHYRFLTRLSHIVASSGLSFFILVTFGLINMRYYNMYMFKYFKYFYRRFIFYVVNSFFFLHNSFLESFLFSQYFLQRDYLNYEFFSFLLVNYYSNDFDSALILGRPEIVIALTDDSNGNFFFNALRPFIFNFTVFRFNFIRFFRKFLASFIFSLFLRLVNFDFLHIFFEQAFDSVLIFSKIFIFGFFLNQFLTSIFYLRQIMYRVLIDDKFLHFRYSFFIYIFTFQDVFFKLIINNKLLFFFLFFSSSVRTRQRFFFFFFLLRHLELYDIYHLFNVRFSVNDIFPKKYPQEIYLA